MLCRGGVGCNKLESVEFPEEEARVENAGNNWAWKVFVSTFITTVTCHSSEFSKVAFAAIATPGHSTSFLGGQGPFPRS